MNENFGEKSRNPEIAKTTEDASELETLAINDRIEKATTELESAKKDLEEWRNANSTHPSHFEYELPEIQNRITRNEQIITSGKIDLEIVDSDAKTPEQKDEVVRDFICRQIIEGRTAKLRAELSDIKITLNDFTQRRDRNDRAVEELQKEIEEISDDIKSSQGDSRRLRSVRSEAIRDLNALLDRQDELKAEEIKLEKLKEKIPRIEAEIDEITSQEVTDEEMPDSPQSDPDFPACLREASTYRSEDDRKYKEEMRYDPQKTATAIFGNRFRQKAAYYSRRANLG